MKWSVSIFKWSRLQWGCFQRCGLRSLGLVTLLYCSITSVADASVLTILIGDEDNIEYRKISRHYKRSLRSRLHGAPLDIRIFKIGDNPQTIRDSDFLLSLGSRAADTALELRAGKPLLCALISRSSFNATVLGRYPSVEQALASGVAALYLDQPRERLFQLARLIMPDADQAGSVLGPLLKTQQTELAHDAQSVGMALETTLLDTTDNPVASLDRLVKNVDIMIALPDKVEVNRQTAKWLLYLSFRRHKPLIAFSRRYTEAGAVASVYSSPKDVAEEAAALSAAMIEHPGPGKSYWPSRFSVSTNPKVARTLGLDLHNNKYYQRKLAEWEGINE